MLYLYIYLYSYYAMLYAPVGGNAEQIGAREGRVAAVRCAGDVAFAYKSINIYAYIHIYIYIYIHIYNCIICYTILYCTILYCTILYYNTPSARSPPNASKKRIDVVAELLPPWRTRSSRH